jgi:hypothetical protein
MNKFTISVENSDGTTERLFTSTNKTEAQQYFIRAVDLFSELDVFMGVEPIKA